MAVLETKKRAWASRGSPSPYKQRVLEQAGHLDCCRPREEGRVLIWLSTLMDSLRRIFCGAIGPTIYHTSIASLPAADYPTPRCLMSDWTVDSWLPAYSVIIVIVARCHHYQVESQH